MRVTRHHRLPFDASCEFVASRAMRINGAAHAIGDAIDKTEIDLRRLSLMYEQRLIQYAPGETPTQAPAKPCAVGPTDFVYPDHVNRPPPSRTRASRVRSKRAAA